MVAYQANEEKIISGMMRDYLYGLEQFEEQQEAVESKLGQAPKLSLRSQ